MTMKDKHNITKIISILFSLIVVVLLIKLFFFDTKLGFNTEILELNYSAFPMCVDVIIIIIMIPLLVYAITYSFIEWIYIKLFV